MTDHVILCVLSELKLSSTTPGDTAEKSLPSEQTFSNFEIKNPNGTIVQSKHSYSGIQANEAPIKHIIRQSNASNPVTDVIFLCRIRETEKSIPARAANQRLKMREASEPLSTEDFLFERIEEFCKDEGFPTPTFTPLPYDPFNPANSMTSILDKLEEGSTVSIDITGGQRDSAFLLSVMANVLKGGFKSISVGDIIYSNFGNKKIYRQNNTFDLIDLAHAVNAFTKYGRADQLNTFFGSDKEWTTPETKRLVLEMNKFSDMMALCQVRDIDKQITAIYDSMDVVMCELKKRKNMFDLYSAVIGQIEGANWLYEDDFDEALEKLAQIDQRITPALREMHATEMKEALETWQRDYLIERNELLFYYLIPTIKDEFILKTDNDGDRILNILKWCLANKMTQQALCIFRELISSCLLEKDYFKPAPAFFELPENKQSAELVDLLLHGWITNEGLALVAEKKIGAKEPYRYFTIVKGKEKSLRQIYAWFEYIRVTRNKIMHLGEERGSLSYYLSIELLGIDRDKTPSLDTITNDMLEAIHDIESPIEVSNREWQECLDQAYQDCKRFKQRTEDGSNKIEEDEAVFADDSSPSGLFGRISEDTLNKLREIE